jgi:hypothetical protein
MKLTGENRSTCPSATLSTTNPTWTDPGSNPDLRGGRPGFDPMERPIKTTKLHSQIEIMTILSVLVHCLPHAGG